MRCKFDLRKSRVVHGKHGISLERAQEVFDQVYVVDQKSDDPEQYRAIGWCQGVLWSVIFEIREDRQGEYYYLVTAWKATTQEEGNYAESC